MNRTQHEPIRKPLPGPCGEREPHEPHDDEYLQAQLHEIAQARLNAADGRVAQAPAIAVLRDLDPPRFAQSVLDFTATLHPDTARAWAGAFTRSIFLAGNPRNLAQRQPPTWIGAHDRIAWYAPDPGPRHHQLRRMLRLVDGALPGGPPLPPYTLRVPHGASRLAGHRRLTMATCGLTLPQYLVHLSHTLAESRLAGALAPGDQVTVQHAAHIAELPSKAAYVRAHRDPSRPGKLRAYACLAAEPTRRAIEEQPCP